MQNIYNTYNFNVKMIYIQYKRKNWTRFKVHKKNKTKSLHTFRKKKKTRNNNFAITMHRSYFGIKFPKSGVFFII